MRAEEIHEITLDRAEKTFTIWIISWIVLPGKGTSQKQGTTVGANRCLGPWKQVSIESLTP